MESILDKKMFNYFIQLNEQEKKSVIQMLKTFLKNRQEKEQRISIDQYNKELEEAMEEIKRGEVFSHDEVVKMAKVGNGKKRSYLDEESSQRVS